MEKKYTVTLRLSYQQYAWLGALCRRSKQTQSEVIRALIENGSVNTYGFFAVADRCKEMAQYINLLIIRLKDDR